MNESYTSHNPNSQLDYSVEQFVLPLDLSKKIDDKDPYWTFTEVMREVNLNKYLKPHRGNKGYDRKRMIRAILFAFMIGEYSLRKIESACRNDIRFMKIMDFEEPSFMAFSRMFSKDIKENFLDIFIEINDILEQKDNINSRVLYIDGTMLEANANKFTFVWRKTAESSLKKSIERAEETIREAVKITELEEVKSITVSELDRFLDQLWTYCKGHMISFVYGKGKHKTPEQRLYEQIKGYRDKIGECEEKLRIMGKDRNSYSKTDHSATFMHMKYDYYMNTGVFKPGYNIQAGICDGYIRDLYISNARTDSRTLIPFLKNYEQHYGSLPGIVVADAGYGSFENYKYCKEKEIDAYIKYQNYMLEKSVGFKKQQFRKENLLHEEKGKKYCPRNSEFTLKEEKIRKVGEYEQTMRVYECRSCKNCKYRKQCTQAKGNRRIQIAPELDELKAEARERLDAPAGIQLRAQRSIQAEGTFGVIKQDYGYNRIRRRGMENVENEIYLTAIGYNLMKYHRNKIQKLTS